MLHRCVLFGLVHDGHVFQVQKAVVGLVVVEAPEGIIRTEATTCLVGALGAVLALGSEREIWVLEHLLEERQMTTANTLLTLRSGRRTSSEMCIW